MLLEFLVHEKVLGKRCIFLSTDLYRLGCKINMHVKQVNNYVVLFCIF